MNLKQTFKKQGGTKLLKQYYKGGALLTAFSEFILLGKSQSALEILRLSTQLKTKQKLLRKYNSVLEKFDKEFKDNILHEKSNKVWICWFQGIENAPLLVRKCYESVKNNLPSKEVILITNKNIEEYISLPPYIIEKWEKGLITHTHMTDLMRLELLIKYGGMWLDATVFCSSPEKEIPDYFFESDLFLYQCLKPGRDGHANYISSWLISAKTNNKVLMAVRELCYSYWKENNDMWDYFLFHDFMCITLDKYEDEKRRIIPRDNATPHILLLRLFEKYDQMTWEAIKLQTPFHKLSYKFDEEQTKKQGTYYDMIIQERIYI